MTDGSSYKLGDTAKLEVLITNWSAGSSVYLYGSLDWAEGASISISLKDVASGAEVIPHIVGGPPSPPPSSRENFVEFRPWHVYGVVFGMTLAQLNLQRKGEYEMRAQYHSPVDVSDSFGLPIWSRQDGPVLSNSVRIKVSE